MPFSYVKEKEEIRRAVSESEPEVEDDGELSDLSSENDGDGEVEPVERFSEAFGLSEKEFKTLAEGSVFKFRNGELVARPI